MILGKQISLSEAIVAILANQENASAKELHREICRTRRPYSLVAVYKELARLQSEGILAKAADSYSLKLTWVINATGFFNQMFKFHFHRCPYKNLIPAANESFTWRFTDFSKVDDLWEQILFALFARSKQKILLSWMPHPWYHLTDDDKQGPYENAMRAMNIKIFRIIGGRTFLDRESIQHWTEPVYAVSLARSPFDGDLCHYIDVIDDYVLTIKLNDQTASLLEDLYNSVESRESLATAPQRKIFSNPVKITVKLQHNQRKARRLQKQFREFWGLPRYRSP